jgi:DNA helicase II / ATP-dependent DNA helicase PcrA
VAVTRTRERLFILDTAARNSKIKSVFLQDLERRMGLSPVRLDQVHNDVWTIPVEDLREDSPPPIQINLSDLLLYIECPYQFGLHRITGLQPSVGDELGFGKGLHELIQRRAESDGAWSNQEITAQVAKHVHLPLTSEEAEDLAKAAIAQRIAGLDELGAFTTGELQQELPVEVFLEDGIISGVIDCVFREPGGSLVVRDWKANIHEEFLTRYARQLQFYVYALRTQNRTVSRAELVDVGASAKAKKIIAIPVDISEGAIDMLIKRCQDALQKIQQNGFQPTPSGAVCIGCDLRRLCAEREGDNSCGN